MNLQFLTIEKDSHIATVTLNRPEASNALNRDLMAEITAAAQSFMADTETRVVIFTGAGRHFSAGADLKEPRAAEHAKKTLLERQRLSRIGPGMIRALMEIPQITIAAVNGAALGGGACIATALDFRIGAQDCAVGYPEVNLGIPLSWISLPLCVHLVGPARAKRMVILGRKEEAGTLLQWGLLDEVAPPQELLTRAREMASQYAAQPPIAAQMIKRSINAIQAVLDQGLMHMDADQVLLAHTTEDWREGVAAFLEKRPPRFRGA